MIRPLFELPLCVGDSIVGEGTGDCFIMFRPPYTVTVLPTLLPYSSPLTFGELIVLLPP